ncbi:MAG: hypothetical protein A2017_14945 [Lentisphaerae bacterium GWF2_44_16]|nr:MAG: hypothetical protein A2017_14945 [Lentisphaerae bacterium GWF2_44_16]
MSEQPKIKILIVDDDANILTSFERLFHKHFQICTSTDPLKALEIFEKEGPFAVVLSDMHMPGIDGIAFLSKVRERNSDSVRMMLTGDADIQVAVNAVNEGHIFRFLLKPCEPTVMANALLVGMQQYKLITAEHELLEQTLKGSIQVLVEILSMTNPVAFGRAKRICNYAVQIAAKMGLQDIWQYEIAALLSQIGCITIPTDTVEKFFSSIELTETEKSMFTAHPSVAHGLLKNIPRMQQIAEMIKLQNHVLPKEKYQKSLKEIEIPVIGGLILKSCIEFELFLSKNISSAEAVRKIAETSASLIPELQDAFRAVQVPEYESNDFRYVKISELVDGMILADAIYSKTGSLVVSGGSIINHTIRQRLINFSKQDIIENTAKIAVPKK